MSKKGRSTDMMKEDILSLLTRHTHGLSIDDVARFLEISRVTASKYLAVMAAESKIVIRSVGNTKLHYLTKDYTQTRAPVKSTKGGKQ